MPNSMKTLMENFQRYTQSVLKEDADPSKVDPEKFPKALSQVAKRQAQVYTKSGDPELDSNDEDDKIDVNKEGTWSAKDLLPSQNSMNLGKASWFALGMLNGTMYGSGGPGGDLGAFVASDNYMMDGHHRWAATSMVAPETPISGYDVRFPGAQLVRILNTITKGLLGVEKGKQGKGNFAQFSKPEKVKEVLTALATDSHPKFKGVAGDKAEGKALEVMEKETGKKGEEAIEAMTTLIVNNVSQVPGMSDSAVMPGASARPDMPVIDDNDGPVQPASKIAIDALETGKIDVNPPYGAQKALKGKTAKVAQRRKKAGVRDLPG